MKKIRVIALLLTITFVLAVLYSIYIRNTFNEWTAFFGSYLEDSLLGASIFILLAAISAMLSPFSSAPLALIAVVIWGPFLTAAMLVTGWVIGGIASYFIGKKFGYYIASKFIAHNKIDRWSRQIDRKISIFLALSFRMMTPSETGYIFGIIKYPFHKYVLVTFLSEIPIALAISYAGSAIIARENEIFLLLAAASAAFLFIFYRIYKKEFQHIV